MTTANTLAALVNGNSEVVVPSGGIAFTDLDSSNDSATANEAYVLGQDGYEEGTWSSTSLSSLVNVTFPYTSGESTTFSGSYTKIGNRVILSVGSNGAPIGDIQATNTFTKFTINGLPFTSKSGQNSFGVVWDGYREMMGACFISSNTSSIFIYFDNISVGFINQVVPRFTITYETS